MKLGIEGRNAIVCGGSKGIGLATAEALAGAGVKVLIIARNSNALEAAQKKIQSQGGTAEILKGDVSDPDLPAKAVSRCNDLWGTVDILVNNTGGPPMGTILEHDESKWEEAIQSCFLSVLRFCKAALPGMKEQNWGRIVSVTSTIAKEPTPGMILSAATRAGVSALTKTIAIEFAKFNISANAICPGGVLTDRMVNLMHVRAERESREYDDILKESQNYIPADRFADPAEIADVIAFLASERGGYINGVSLSVDGALTKAFN